MTKRPPDFEPLLRRTAEMALSYIESLPDRHVGSRQDAAEIADRLRVAFPDEEEDPLAVIERLASVPGARVLNDVVLNQVLVRFDDDDRTRSVIRGVQAGGEAWMGGTTWQGRAAMRVSVSGWSTTEADIDRTVATIEATARS